MKKLISFVLVLAMVLGCVSMAFATFEDLDGCKNANAINALFDLGVVDGVGANKFAPDKTLTRSQMAKMLVSALAVEPSSTAASFPDCVAGSWYAPYVDLANQLGIVKGYPDGTFKPDKEVSGSEAIIMAVRALGYTDEYFGGFNTAKYLNQAVALGLMKDVTAGSAASTRANAAQLIANCLTVHRVSIDKDGASQPITVNSVPDTMQARLAGQLYDPDPSDPAVKPGDAFVYTGASIAAKGVNLKAYLGKKIVAFANKDNEVVGIKEVKTTTLTGKFSASGAAFTTTADNVKYTVSVNTNAGVEYFRNGVHTGVASFSAIDGTPVAIEVTVSGKTIKTIESVSEWSTTYKFRYTATSFDKTGKTLGSQKFALNDDNEIDTTSFELVGVNSLADIAKNNVVYVYVGGTTITKVEVGTEVIEGTLTSKTNNGVYTIAGKEVKEAGTAVGTFTIGATGKYLLDAAGKLYTVIDVDLTTEYGVLLNITDGAIDWTKTAPAKVQLVKQDASKEIININKKASKLVEEASNKITKEAITLYDIVSGGALQVVSYALNVDGELTVMTTAGTKAANVKVYADGVVSASGFNGCLVTADTKVLFKNGTTYTVGTGADLFGVASCTMTAVTKDGKITFAFVEDSSASEAKYYVATGYKEVYNDKGTYAYEQSFLCNGEVVKFNSKISVAPSSTPELVKLTFSGNILQSTGGACNKTKVMVATTTDVAISERVVSMGIDTATVSSDVMVYVWDATNETWTVGEASNLNVAHSATAKVTFFNTSTDNGAYNVAFVVK